MNLATSALQTIESRLPNPIDARTHGLIDYSHAVFFLTLALFARKQNPRAAAAALLTGSFVLVQALLTDYPLGAQPVLDFETHGKIDTAFAGLSTFLPNLFGFADSKLASVFVTNAFVEATVVALTDFKSTQAAEAS